MPGCGRGISPARLILCAVTSDIGMVVVRNSVSLVRCSNCTTPSSIGAVLSWPLSSKAAGDVPLSTLREA
jgi:hypothetical protein